MGVAGGRQGGRYNVPKNSIISLAVSAGRWPFS